MGEVLQNEKLLQTSKLFEKEVSFSKNQYRTFKTLRKMINIDETFRYILCDCCYLSKTQKL